MVVLNQYRIKKHLMPHHLVQYMSKKYSQLILYLLDKLYNVRTVQAQLNKKGDRNLTHLKISHCTNSNLISKAINTDSLGTIHFNKCSITLKKK